MWSTKYDQVVYCAALLCGILIFFWWRTRNKAKAQIVLDLPDKLIILGLMLVYGALSFINLGELKNYSSWNGNKLGDHFVLKLAKPEPLSKIYYYLGYGTGNMAVEYTTESGWSDRERFANDNENFNYAAYHWEAINIVTQDKITALEFMVDSNSPIELKQLAIYNSAGKRITDFQVVDSDKNLTELFSMPVPEHKENMASNAFLDEYFYGLTAYQYLHDTQPYAWAHPQLALLFITLGVLLFGTNPFGWRFFPNLTGILLVGVIYLFAKRLFGSRRWAIVASLLLIFDFMHFSFTRTASLDAFTALFVTLEYYFLYDYFCKRSNRSASSQAWRSLLWCGLLFGLAISTKLVALYSILTLAPIVIYGELILNKSDGIFKKMCWSLSLLVLVPLLIYGIVYLPFYRLAQDQSFIGFILRYQQEMFNFHTTGKIGATHPFNSPWWSWPLNLKPDEVWFGSAANSSTASAISLMGNPLIWFGGLVAILFATWQGVMQKKSLALFLSLSGLSLYLPWILMGHYTFIYYLYIAIPLWVLALTYLLSIVYSNGGKLGVYFYLLIVAALFVIYYPDISGIEFARNYVLNHLRFY